MTYESLSDGGFATGSMLGSGGFIVYIYSLYCEKHMEFFSFYHHESCGQCTPCREGTGWLEKYCTESKLVLDVKRILIYCGVFNQIEGNTICPLDAAWPVAAAIRHFREEFEYHVRFPERIKNRDHFVAEPFEK
jgi:NADH-quinone oxidoreductase subunit F